MPRTKRIDEPDLQYHLFSRGIEKKPIFRDDADRDFFLSRLGHIVVESRARIFSFALLGNHFHLLLRRENVRVATIMSRLLTSYAVYFNRRHERAGHLFQNRYKARLCPDERYFLELIRYIHLNPLRSGEVKTYQELSNYRYSGHSFILGNCQTDWLKPSSILVHFGSKTGEARKEYSRFLREGFIGGCDLDFFNESTEVKHTRPEEKECTGADWGTLPKGNGIKPDADEIIASVCADLDVQLDELLSGSRKSRISRARAVATCRLVYDAGLCGTDVASMLGITKAAVSLILSRSKVNQSLLTR